MSRLLEFFLYSSLNTMGWPRAKGIFRRRYVDSLLADTLTEQGLQIIIWLGAARPEVAVAMLADTFSGNPWTEESTQGLIGNLEKAQVLVTDNPGKRPWQALWSESRLSSYNREWRWSDMFDDSVGMVRAQASSRAAWWGLTNEHLMQALFDQEKSAYQNSAVEANHFGLGVSNTYPFESLEGWYEYCDTILLAFNEALPPFHGIPPQLKAVPEIARRLQ